MTELHDLTALEQAAAVRTGEVSPTQLVEHCLSRIEDLDAGLGAYPTVTSERALEAHNEGRDPAQAVLDELGRAHLARTDGGRLLEGGQVVQLGHGRRR